MTTLARRPDAYASRTGGRGRRVPRPDPVVWGDGSGGPLSPAEVERFAEQGYLFFPGLFSAAEMEALLAEGRRLAESVDPDRPEVIAEPETRTVRSLFRVHRESRIFRDVCHDPRLADVARQILGSDVYLHQTRINYKPALHGKEFFWHSDFETWHVEDGMPRPRALSASLAMTPNGEFNGPLMVIPGSHRTFLSCPGETPEENFRRSLVRQEIGVPGEEDLRVLVEAGGIEAPKGPAGSVLFFDSNLMHGSGSNLSPWPRTNLFLVMNSVENALGPPFSGLPPRPDFLAERQVVPLRRPV